MKVLDFYKTLFHSLGLTVDDEGVVRTDYDPSAEIKIGEKFLMLPIKSELTNPDYENKVYFHPLSEDVLVGGESKVIKRLRKLINRRLNTLSFMLAHELLGIAADESLHKKLRPDQHILVQLLPNANKKALRDLNKVIKTLTSEDKSILDVFVKPNGLYRDVKCSRTAIVKFFFERDDENLEFMGVEIGTKRDKKIISDLFEYLFNTNGDVEYYNYGSNDATAPHFHALLGGFMRVGGRLNELIRLFDNLLSPEFKETLGKHFTPVFAWEPMLSLFPVLSVEIPPLPDNTGSAESTKGKVNVGMNSSTNQVARTGYQRPDEPETNASEVKPARKGVPLSEVLNQRPVAAAATSSSWNDNKSSSSWKNENTGSNWGGGSSFSNNNSNSWSQQSSSFSSGFSDSIKRKPTLADINVGQSQINQWGRG